LVRLQTEQWLRAGVVEPIDHPTWTNNLVLAEKQDGRVRVCVDCTPANRQTEELDWPLPRLQDVRHFVRGSSWFARLDLKDAFFRIRVPRKWRYLTAYRVGGQTYQFKRMPFGLKTAPAHFQRFMDTHLAPFKGWALWYIDDVLIKAETRAQLLARVAAVRARLRKIGCTVNEDKSETERRALLFAGLWVYADGVGPNAKKVEQVLTLSVPTTKAAMQSALGLVSYLRDFVPLASHFTAKLHPDKNGLTLPENQLQEEWARLRRHLATAITTTRHWKDGIDADLFLDASGHGLGAVLIQEGKIVALASRKLSAAETRYSATDREHLALVFGAKKFRVFLHQSQSTTRIRTDHAALTTRRADDMTPRQMRWKTICDAWMPKVEHVRGKDNPADFVSRWNWEFQGGAVRA